MDAKFAALRHTLGHPARIAYLAVVVIGYGVGLLSSWPDISPSTLLTTLLLTVVYLTLGLREDIYFARFPTPVGKALYFIVQLSLVTTIQVLLEPGASWLMSLPLAGTAVERLHRPWTWLVYLAILAGMFIPLWLRFTWQDAAIFTLTFSPAILFVVVFTQMTLRAQEARGKAEALAQELEEANRQLAAYAAQAEELAMTKERNRLAREIHDNLGHYLTIVNVQIRAAQAVMASDPLRAQDALEKAQQLTQDGLSAIRESIAALRESPLQNKPLSTALNELLADTQQAGIVTEFVQQGKPRDLDEKTALTLYRTAQEALTNARKHAHASRVDVTIDYRAGDRVALLIEDNGVGTAVDPTSGTHKGFGLLGIAERIHLLGGDFEINSESGRGFALRVCVPG